MRNTIIGVSVLAFMVLPTSALAWGDYSHHYKHGNQNHHSLGSGNNSRGSDGSSVGVPTSTPPVVVPPITPPIVAAPEEIRTTIYDTLFGYPDNTPANSSILSNGGQAGGTGTFNDPITMASGYVLVNGQPTWRVLPRAIAHR